MKKHKPKISVIIPIYNVEKYIERCARSLMEQTLDDIEYIFVDDCTPDHSIEILQQVLVDYPNRRDSIKIIHHNTNMGSATVRNTGLKNASGEYVIHCDSDDWVDADAYEDMYLKAKETDADIVATDFFEEYPNRSILCKQNYSDDSVTCIKRMLSGELHCSTCNKLVKRELYEKNDIHFPDGINMWEDVLTTIPLFYNAKKIAYIPKGYYHYVQYNGGSYTKQLNKSSLSNLIEAVQYLEAFVIRKYQLEVFKKGLCYTKLTVKLNLLLNSSGKQQYEWSRFYPEANAYLFTHPVMSFYWKLALGSAVWHLLSIFNLMAWMAKRIKTR